MHFEIPEPYINAWSIYSCLGTEGTEFMPSSSKSHPPDVCASWHIRSVNTWQMAHGLLSQLQLPQKCNNNRNKHIFKVHQPHPWPLSLLCCSPNLVIVVNVDTCHKCYSPDCSEVSSKNHLLLKIAQISPAGEMGKDPTHIYAFCRGQLHLWHNYYEIIHHHGIAMCLPGTLHDNNRRLRLL